MNFGTIFKKLRLRSGIATLSEFGNALAERGFVFEESLFSHWQKNDRIPKDRRLLLTILKLFFERGGISSIRDMNNFLESADQGDLKERESLEISGLTKLPGKLNSPKKVLQFFITTARSKKLTRTGWVRKRSKIRKAWRSTHSNSASWQ